MTYSWQGCTALTENMDVLYINGLHNILDGQEANRKHNLVYHIGWEQVNIINKRTAYGDQANEASHKRMAKITKKVPTI